MSVQAELLCSRCIMETGHTGDYRRFIAAALNRYRSCKPIRQAKQIHTKKRRIQSRAYRNTLFPSRSLLFTRSIVKASWESSIFSGVGLLKKSQV